MMEVPRDLAGDIRGLRALALIDAVPMMAGPVEGLRGGALTSVRRGQEVHGGRQRRCLNMAALDPTPMLWLSAA